MCPARHSWPRLPGSALSRTRSAALCELRGKGAVGKRTPGGLAHCDGGRFSVASFPGLGSYDSAKPHGGGAVAAGARRWPPPSRGGPSSRATSLARHPPPSSLSLATAASTAAPPQACLTTMEYLLAGPFQSEENGQPPASRFTQGEGAALDVPVAGWAGACVTGWQGREASRQQRRLLPRTPPGTRPTRRVRAAEGCVGKWKQDHPRCTIIASSALGHF